MTDIHNDISWVGSLLKATSTRHRAISSNIANANTPGYRPLEVKFEETLRGMLQGSRRLDSEAIAKLEPEVVEQDDGRHVILERELMDLMKNQLAYDTYAQIVSMKMGMLKAAISSRGS